MKMAPFDVKNKNYHLGHLFMDVMRIHPNDICQVDAATDQSETNASVLARSIQLAKCFHKFGLKPGDVLFLGGRNHLDLYIPYYAALMNGITIVGVDRLFKSREINALFKVCVPNVVFCQEEQMNYYEKVIAERGLNIKIICFGTGENSMAKFIEQYDDKKDKVEFLPTLFDTEKIYIWLICTGGTTGVVKCAAFKTKPVINKLLCMNFFISPSKNPNGGNKMGLHLTPMQWVSGFINPMALPVMNLTRLQTSADSTIDDIIDLFNHYKPDTSYISPPPLTALLRSPKKCDFTCCNNVIVGGGKVHKDLYLELKERMNPSARVIEGYGQTENLGILLTTIHGNGPLGNCGKELSPFYTVKLVDPTTGKDVTEPKVPGELWVKGASFSEYYNNPEETAKVITDDGWYRSGDILYKDENGYFFFVERTNMLFRYRHYQIIPAEIEAVIREHPGVIDVSVTSIHHDEDGEHPVACVMRKPGDTVTAEEIKNLVASTLNDAQKLRGGVVFMDQLPMTSTGKIARAKIHELVLTAHRE